MGIFRSKYIGIIFSIILFVVLLACSFSFVSSKLTSSSIRVDFTVEGCKSEEGNLDFNQCSASGKYYCSSKGKLLNTVKDFESCFMADALGGDECCPEGYYCDSKDGICKNKSYLFFKDKEFIGLVFLVLIFICVFVFYYKIKKKKIKKKGKSKRKS